jgi:hypothetical protein
MTHEDTWIIANHDGVPITVRVKTDSGWEDMIYYSNWEAAQNVLDIMPPDEVSKHGAHLQKIVMV